MDIHYQIYTIQFNIYLILISTDISYNIQQYTTSPNGEKEDSKDSAKKIFLEKAVSFQCKHVHFFSRLGISLRRSLEHFVPTGQFIGWIIYVSRIVVEIRGIAMGFDLKNFISHYPFHKGSLFELYEFVDIIYDAKQLHTFGMYGGVKDLLSRPSQWKPWNHL